MINFNSDLKNFQKDFEHWDDVGLNMERPVSLLTMYRQRFRPAFPAQIVQTGNSETQTEDTSNDSSDLTMQLGGSTEESGNNSYDISSLPSSTKSEGKIVSVPTQHDIRESMISKSLSFNASHLNVEKPSTVSLAPLPRSLMATRFDPHHIPPTFPQQVQLQNSARALKEELQQGVEDVCQKLNSFFSKPPSLSGSSVNNAMGYTHVKPSDRSSFSLFHTK